MRIIKPSDVLSEHKYIDHGKYNPSVALFSRIALMQAIGKSYFRHAVPYFFQDEYISWKHTLGASDEEETTLERCYGGATCAFVDFDVVMSQDSRAVLPDTFATSLLLTDLGFLNYYQKEPTITSSISGIIEALKEHGAFDLENLVDIMSVQPRRYISSGDCVPLMWEAMRACASRAQVGDIGSEKHPLTLATLLPFTYNRKYGLSATIFALIEARKLDIRVALRVLMARPGFIATTVQIMQQVLPDDLTTLINEYREMFKRTLRMYGGEEPPLNDRQEIAKFEALWRILKDLGFSDSWAQETIAGLPFAYSWENYWFPPFSGLRYLTAFLQIPSADTIPEYLTSVVQHLPHADFVSNFLCDINVLERILSDAWMLFEKDPLPPKTKLADALQIACTAWSQQDTTADKCYEKTKYVLDMLNLCSHHVGKSEAIARAKEHAEQGLWQIQLRRNIALKIAGFAQALMRDAANASDSETIIPIALRAREWLDSVFSPELRAPSAPQVEGMAAVQGL